MEMQVYAFKINAIGVEGPDKKTQIFASIWSMSGANHYPGTGFDKSVVFTRCELHHTLHHAGHGLHGKPAHVRHTLAGVGIS